MSKINLNIVNSASLGFGFKKNIEECQRGFVKSESGCIQKDCKNKQYLNNICRCDLDKHCPYGFKCLNNLCLSTDEQCPDNHIRKDNKCIQECKDPKNQNGPLCKCESSDDCNLGQECNTKFKHCLIKEESLDYPLGISPTYEEQLLIRQEFKDKHTHTIFVLVPIIVICLVYFVIKTLDFPFKGVVSELLIITSVLFTNYQRFSKICNTKIYLFGTIRKSIIILGLSSILVRLLLILPPLKLLVSSIGMGAIGIITSLAVTILHLINNQMDDKLEGENYDCNYILGLDTIKDIKEPLNIVFLVSLFMICARIYFSFMASKMSS